MQDKGDPNLDFDISFSYSEENYQLGELKDKMHSTMKPEGLLNFTLLCMRLSVTFIDKSFIYQFNLTRFL